MRHRCTNNINCHSSCNCHHCCDNSNNGFIIGMPKIVHSHEIRNRTQRAVFFSNGGCGVVSKAYIPSTVNLTSNGPPRMPYCCGENTESEGMDCVNYKFNKNRID